MGGLIKICRYELPLIFKLMGEYQNITLAGTDGKINLNSLRLHTFRNKGVKCVSCGLEGTHFYSCMTTGSKILTCHLNLYADNNVLMTKDHILPSSKGGPESLENMQPMCSICNSKKGSVIPVDLPKSLVKYIGYPIITKAERY
jgi:5-methylcytosine-specific restriction endonuclease McrA